MLIHEDPLYMVPLCMQWSSNHVNDQSSIITCHKLKEVIAILRSLLIRIEATINAAALILL